MNPVLEQIVASETVTDGTAVLPLSHPAVPNLPVAVDPAKASSWATSSTPSSPGSPSKSAWPMASQRSTSAKRCAGSRIRPPHRDGSLPDDPMARDRPAQRQRRRLRTHGRLPRRSFRVRPAASPGRRHRNRFRVRRRLAHVRPGDDGVLLLESMLRMGGVIAFDDAERRGINRVIRHALSYPSYASSNRNGASRLMSRWQDACDEA